MEGNNMSTSSITPDADTMENPSYGLSNTVTSAPSTNGSQTPPPVPDAPSVPAVGPRLGSALAAIVSTLPSQRVVNASQPSASSGGTASTNDDDNQPSTGGSKLGSIVGRALSTISTGLASVPSHGRPSAFNGLTEGARGAQEAEATQQNLKFKDMDTQVRLAQLTHQEKVWSNEDQDRVDQLDASAKAQVAQMGDKYGQTYDFVANDDNGQAAMTHLGMKQLQDGSASLPAGVIAAPHGWYVPNKSSQDQSTANTKHFNDQSQFFGVPSTGGQPVNPRAYFAFNNQLLHGQNPDGSFMHSTQIDSLTTTAQQRLDEYKDKPNADPQIVTEAQRHIDDLSNLSEKASDREQDAADQVAANAGQKAQADKQGQINADNSPAGRALAAYNEKLAEQKQDNAASDKTQKAQNVDSNGNPVWVPGATADEKKKAELSENVVFNSNNIASILQRRPDIVGVVAGRFTTLDQMAGTNDPDITALQQDMHNIAMANVGIHGMRSNEAVHDVESNILNSFKNGPKAIGGALQAGAKSVQTFIDNARPNTYKTHSTNGGAMRSMVSPQGQQ
jgi:hypothetical protein